MLIKRDDRPVVAALLAVVFAILLTIRVSSPENVPPEKNATHNQANDIGGEIIAWLMDWNSDRSIAFLTGLIALIGYFQWRHFRVTERAYLKMSHITPKKEDAGTPKPEVVEQALMWIGPDTCTFQVTYEVKNHGRTPARVTATGTAYEVLDVDEKVTDTGWDPVAEDDRTEAFLVCNDRFEFDDDETITLEEKIACEGGKKILIVSGFVDYIDQFGVRHRSGYARRWLPGDRTRNNLIFTDEHPGMNYDRERTRREGLDWD